MRHLFFISLFCSYFVQAAGFNAPQDPINTLDAPKPVLSISNKTTTDIQAASAPTSNSVQINEQDLANNTTLTESLINQAILQKDGAFLQDLLPIYQQSPNHDTILVQYAQSALWYWQGKRSQAIALQEKLLAEHPNLSYIRMNLASMQIEDKRYGDAKQQLEQLTHTDNPIALQRLANAHLAQINHLTEWRFNGDLSYDRNDNVNNASDIREITINGVTLQKNQDSLPKKAEGFRFGLSSSRLFPLTGNHALQIQSAINGRYYWDNADYTQVNAQFSGSHLYQNKLWLFRTTPFVLQSWLGGASYLHTIGINHTMAYQFQPNWRSQLTFGVRQTKYHRTEYQDFDNRHVFINPMLIYTRPTGYAFLGFQYGNTHTDKPSLSSQTWQIQGGLSKIFPYLGFSASVSYGTERYRQAPELRITPYPFPRSDRIIQTDIALWQPRWQYHGLMPKLNFSYYRINSNMPAFYSRKNHRVYMSIEKEF